MDKFNFKLEKVLDYKKIIETDKKGEYGKAKQKLIKEENVLEDYNRYLSLIHISEPTRH